MNPSPEPTAGPAVTCPNEAQLLQLLEAGLEAREWFLTHLEQCPNCQQRLETLHSLDPVYGDLIEPGVEPSIAGGPEVEAFVRNLRSAFRDPSAAALAQKAAALSRAAVQVGELRLDPIGPYRIERCAGMGGMSIVYQAFDTRLNRLVALKMLLVDGPAPEGDPRRERLAREALMLAALHHPHIVPVYELGEHRGQPYLVLEYVSGGTLAQWAGGRSLPASEAATAVQTLAQAVQYAHEQGVIHRDLKPSNVLLQPVAPLTRAALDPSAVPPLASYRLMISDFGLARWREQEARLTRSDHPVGTPAYMAPEQIGGRSSAIGPAVDQYALGAILYELLTGRPPLQGSSVAETLRLIQEVEPLPPRQLQPGVPVDLETIALKCLEKDPRRRYVTVGALAEDLGRYLSRRPIAARRLGVWGRLARWGQRNRGLAALSVLSLGLLLALAVGGVSVALSQRASRRESDRLRSQAEAQAQQAQASARAAELSARAAGQARDQSRADLERAIESLSGLGRRFAQLGPSLDPAVASIRDQCFGDAVAFARSHLDSVGTPDRWSASELRVALALIQMQRALGQTEASQAVRAQVQAAGDRLVQAEPDRADLVVPLAASSYNEGLLHLNTQQPEPARAEFRTCLALLDRFLSRQPEDAQALRLRVQGGARLAQTVLAVPPTPGAQALEQEAASQLQTNLALIDAHRARFPDTPEQALEEAAQATHLALAQLRLGHPDQVIPAADRVLSVLAPLPGTGPLAGTRRRYQIDALASRRLAHQRLGDTAALLTDLEQLEPLLSEPMPLRITRLQQAETLLALNQADRARDLAESLAADPLVVRELALPLTRVLAVVLARQPAPGAAEAERLTRTALGVLESARAQGRLDPGQAHQALTQDPGFAALRDRPALQTLLQTLQSPGSR